jgi:hypothetical protein
LVLASFLVSVFVLLNPVGVWFDRAARSGLKVLQTDRQQAGEDMNVAPNWSRFRHWRFYAAGGILGAIHERSRRGVLE